MVNQHCGIAGVFFLFSSFFFFVFCMFVDFNVILVFQDSVWPPTLLVGARDYVLPERFIPALGAIPHHM